MAVTVRDARLETRSARKKLPARPEPYWRSINRGAHLGYYKGKNGGSWIARYRTESRYVKNSLGIADDVQDADGISVLSYKQAQERARPWFEEQARREAGVEGPSAYTVRDAIEEYLAWFAVHRKSVYATRRAAEVHT